MFGSLWDIFPTEMILAALKDLTDAFKTVSTITCNSLSTFDGAAAEFTDTKSLRESEPASVKLNQERVARDRKQWKTPMAISANIKPKYSQSKRTSYRPRSAC